VPGVGEERRHVEDRVIRPCAPSVTLNKALGINMLVLAHD
jgi:hypothetical protein